MRTFTLQISGTWWRNSSFKRTYSLLTRLVPYTRQHEGMYAPSAPGFVLRQTLVSPFIHDAEEYDAAGHGR